MLQWRLRTTNSIEIDKRLTDFAKTQLAETPNYSLMPAPRASRQHTIERKPFRGPGQHAVPTLTSLISFSVYFSANQEKGGEYFVYTGLSLV
jgi:hypothetical protein